MVESRRGRADLVKSYAAFDPRVYGHTKLGDLVRKQSYIDVKEVPGPTGISHLLVRIKQPPAQTKS